MLQNTVRQSRASLRGVVFRMCASALLCAPLSTQAFADEQAAPVTSQAPATIAFDQLKALTGTWRVAEREDHPLRIRFYLTAGGKTLVESWEVEDRSHSLTIYHRDDDSLLATHYCPQGNQPRLEMVPGEDGEIRFTLRDVTDLDAETEQHQHDLAFDLTDTSRIVRSEQYKDGEGGMHPGSLVLERVPEATGE